jgi:hypothetical protein
VGAFEPDAATMGLNASAISMRKLVHVAAIPETTTAELCQLADELQGRLDDEMEAAVYLSLLPSEAWLYDNPDPFGGNVTAAFPSTRYDIEEAAKCIALERGTAAVFHLMRVMEVGLRQLAVSLNAPTLDPARNPSWDSILRKCRLELEKPLKDRAREWQAHEQFFSEATAHLMAVKDAWRNPTMHVDAVYDGERAMKVWSSVRVLMAHLAERLHE